MEQKRDPKRLDEEYSLLMELFFHVVNSKAGDPISQDTAWFYGAKVLAAKLFNHLGTIRYLWHGTELPVMGGQRRQYVDHSSVSVLVRAAFETYLCFYYIYSDRRVSSDMRHLRHDIWKLQGFLDRQRISIVPKDKRHIIEREEETVADILSAVEGNSEFSKLTPRLQKAARNGKWRLDYFWVDLAEIAGFDRRVFRDEYSYLCSYVHAGGYSALQIAQATRLEDQQALAECAKYYGIMLMSHFIASYTELFPETKAQLEANSITAELARRRRDTWKEPDFQTGLGLSE